MLWLASEPTPSSMCVGRFAPVWDTLCLTFSTMSGPSDSGVMLRQWQALWRPFSDRPWKKVPLLLVTLGRVATSTKLSQRCVAPLPKPFAFRYATWETLSVLRQATR